MKVIDKVEPLGLLFIEYYLNNRSLYKIYVKGKTVFQGNNFDEATKQWTETIINAD